MQATQSNSASDLLHPDTVELGSTNVGPSRPRELPPALSTPIFLGPIQAARKYMERQRSAGSLSGDAKEATRGEASTSSGSNAQSGSVLGLHNRDHDTRRQDRRLERSLYEGQSSEAGLNKELAIQSESAGSAVNGRAFFANSDGTERPFPYADPYLDSGSAAGSVPDPEAVRNAILRLARESRPVPDLLGGASSLSEENPSRIRAIHANSTIEQAIVAAHPATVTVEERDTQAVAQDLAASVASPRFSNSPQIDTSISSPFPAFADVARRVWAQEPVESAKLADLEEGRGLPETFNVGEQRECSSAMKEGHASTQQDCEVVEGYRDNGKAWDAHQAALGNISPVRTHQAAGGAAVVPLPFISQQTATMPGETITQEADLSPTHIPMPRSVVPDTSEKLQGGKFEDAALAHDACNLLSALGLYSDLLSFPGVLDESRRHYAEELKLIAVRSQVLIDRLLQLRNSSQAVPNAVAKLGGTPDALDLVSVDKKLLHPRNPDTHLPDTRNLAAQNFDGPEDGALADNQWNIHPQVRDTSKVASSNPVTYVASPLQGLRAASQPDVITPAAIVQKNAEYRSSNRPTSLSTADCSSPIQNVSELDSLAVEARPSHLVFSDETVSKEQRCTTLIVPAGPPSEIEQTEARAEWGPAAPLESNEVETTEPNLPTGESIVLEDEFRSTLLGRSGASESQSLPISLVDLLMRWGSLLSTLAHGNLDVAFGPQAATPVAIPAESLERILVNLVKNARAATINGGAIRIGVAVCDAEPLPGARQDSKFDPGLLAGSSPAEGPRRSVVLTVDDSGCGMSDTEVGQILAAENAAESNLASGSEPLSPAVAVSTGDAVSRGSKEGRGLGLRVVKGLVAETGGILAIHSRLGRGTRIEIRWPGAESGPVIVRPSAEVLPSAAIHLLPETAVAHSPQVAPLQVASPAETSAIGPDGFSEQELRLMILRLHRTSPSDHGDAQNLVDGRRPPLSTSKISVRSGNLSPATTNTGTKGAIAC